MVFSLKRKITDFLQSIKIAKIFVNSVLSQVILVFILISPVIVIWLVEPVQAAWYDDDWLFRKKITLVGSSSDLSDYQVKLEGVNTKALYDMGQIQSNCEDLRFTDVQGNMLNYWVEEPVDSFSCSTSPATDIWIRVNRLEAEGTYLYMYYGNSHAEPFSNGYNTFEFFDDFTGNINYQGDTVLNSGKWDAFGNPIIDNAPGTVSLSKSDGLQAIQSKSSFNSGRLIFRAEQSAESFNGKAGFSNSNLTSDFTTDDAAGFQFDSTTGSGFEVFSTNESIPTQRTGKAIEDVNSHIFEIGFYAGQVDLKVDNLQDGAIITNVLDESSRVRIEADNTSENLKVYWVAVTKYSDVDVDTIAITEDQADILSNVQDNLFAFYKMDETVWTGAAGDVVDSSGSNYHATSKNGASLVSGLSGNAGDFDDSSKYAELPAYPLGNTNVTISTWVHLDSTSESGAIVKLGDDLHGYGVGVGSTDWEHDGNDIIILYERVRWIDTNIPIGTGWHHITLVIDSSGNPTVYLDGESRGLYAGDAALTISGLGGIGGYAYGRNIDAVIDDVRIYDWALTSQEVNFAYKLKADNTIEPFIFANQESSPRFNSLNDSLHAYYKMNENSWTGAVDDVLDSSGNNIHGTSKNGANVVSGLDGNAGDFNGLGKYVELPDYDLGNTNVTISTWVNLDSTVEQGAFVKLGDLSSGYGLGVGATRWDNAGGELIALYEGVSWIDTNIPIGTGWHHVAMVIDSAGVPTVYLDGINKASYPGIVAKPVSGLGGIGGYNGTRYVDATIDDVRIYSKALSDSDINLIYILRAIDSASSSSSIDSSIGTDPDKGLIGYWKMDESVWNGTTGEVKDSSNYHNDGVRRGSATTVVDGYKDRSGYFGGSPNYVEVPDSPSLRPSNAVSISIWVNVANNTQWHNMVTKRYAYGDPYNSYILGTSGGYWTFCLSNGTAGTQTCINSTSPVAPNTWVHLVGTYDGSEMKMFVNSNLESHTPKTGTIGYTSENLWLGTSLTSQAPQYMIGKLDEVRIYDRALTEDDLNYLYGYLSYTEGEQGVIGYWKMNEASWNSTSGEVKDSSGNNKNGTAYNGAYITSAGKYDNAGVFAGDNDFVAMPQTNLGSKFSISVWVKPNAKSNSGLIANTASGATTNGIKLYLNTWNSTDGKIIFETGNGSGGSTTSTPTGVLQWGVWQHIVVVVDVTTNSAKIYHNGVDRTASNGVISGVNTNQTWRVGSFMNNGFYYSGGVDELKLYNYKLTDQDVAAVYNDRVTEIELGDIRAGVENGNTANLIAHYEFEKKNGTTAYDSIEGDQNAIMYNMSADVNSVHGKTGNAYNFHGTNEFISAGDVLDNVFAGGSFSASAWIKPSNAGSASSQVVVAKLADTALSENQREWAFIMASNKINFNYYGSLGTTSYRSFSTPANSIINDVWQHVSFTYDASASYNDRVKIYINGISQSLTIPYSAGSPSSIQNGTAPLAIGAVVNTSKTQSAYNFAGIIDSVKIYNSVLGTREIACEYNDGAPVGWWKFDRGQGNTAYDYSGNGNHGTMQNMDPLSDWLDSSNCKLNGCMDFDGGNDYISIADNNILDVSSEFSFSLWVKQRSSSPTQGYRLLDKNTAGEDDGFGFDTYDGATGRKMRVCGAGGCYMANTVYQLDKWNHLVVTYSGGVISFYLNGKLDGSYSTTSSYFNINNLDLRIAAPHVGCGGTCGLSEYFNGKMDDVKIFRYQLTDDDIKREYNLGASLKFN